MDCRAVALAKADRYERVGAFGGGLRLGKPDFASMSQFFYVYILQSTIDPERFYIGCTRDLRARLRTHNSGAVAHTVKCKPWRVKTYVALSDEGCARELERYLKSSSGRAFTKKRL